MSILDIIARCRDIHINDNVELIVWLENEKLSKYLGCNRLYRKVNISVLDLIGLKSLGTEYSINYSIKNGLKIECTSNELYFEIENFMK